MLSTSVAALPSTIAVKVGCTLHEPGESASSSSAPSATISRHCVETWYASNAQRGNVPRREGTFSRLVRVERGRAVLGVDRHAHRHERRRVRAVARLELAVRRVHDLLRREEEAVLARRVREDPADLAQPQHRRELLDRLLVRVLEQLEAVARAVLRRLADALDAHRVVVLERAVQHADARLPPAELLQVVLEDLARVGVEAHARARRLALALELELVLRVHQLELGERPRLLHVAERGHARPEAALRDVVVVRLRDDRAVRADLRRDRLLLRARRRRLRVLRARPRGGRGLGREVVRSRAAGRGVQSLAPSLARAREVQRTRGLALSKIKKSIDPFAVRPFCWSVLAGSSFCEPPWSCERRAGHKST